MVIFNSYVKLPEGISDGGPARVNNSKPLPVMVDGIINLFFSVLFRFTLNNAPFMQDETTY
jgi:hypothetical protein